MGEAAACFRADLSRAFPDVEVFGFPLPEGAEEGGATLFAGMSRSEMARLLRAGERLLHGRTVECRAGAAESLRQSPRCLEGSGADSGSELREHSDAARQLALSVQL